MSIFQVHDPLKYTLEDAIRLEHVARGNVCVMAERFSGFPSKREVIKALEEWAGYRELLARKQAEHNPVLNNGESLKPVASDEPAAIKSSFVEDLAKLIQQYREDLGVMPSMTSDVTATFLSGVLINYIFAVSNHESIPIDAEFEE